MAKINYERFTSPLGTAQYPKLTTPDTKFDPDGVYSVKLIVPMEDAAAFIGKLEAVRDAEFDKLEPKKQKSHSKAAVYEEECDDEGEDTGNVIFRFKLKANVTPKSGKSWSQAPVLFDAKNNKMGSDIEPWGGTRMKVAGEIVPYAMASTKQVGVSLRLKAAQIIELVTGGGANAEAYGFGEVDEGYVAPAAEAGFDDEGEDF